MRRLLVTRMNRPCTTTATTDIPTVILMRMDTTPICGDLRSGSDTVLVMGSGADSMDEDLPDRDSMDTDPLADLSVTAHLETREELDMAEALAADTWVVAAEALAADIWVVAADLEVDTGAEAEEAGDKLLGYREFVFVSKLSSA
jgi:hypothetical protein